MKYDLPKRSHATFKITRFYTSNSGIYKIITLLLIMMRLLKIMLEWQQEYIFRMCTILTYLLPLRIFQK